MSVNSITGEVAAFKLVSLNSTGPLDKLVNGAPSTNGGSSKQTVQSSTVDGNTDKVSPVNKQSPVARDESDKKPARVMNHVIESYNQQGKVRIKFMDNNNNVIYQIPSEMVAKIEDQMMKPETFADIKG